jgi:hypothetical protein
MSSLMMNWMLSPTMNWMLSPTMNLTMTCCHLPWWRRRHLRRRRRQAAKTPLLRISNFSSSFHLCSMPVMLRLAHEPGRVSLDGDNHGVAIRLHVFGQGDLMVAGKGAD